LQPEAGLVQKVSANVFELLIYKVGSILYFKHFRKFYFVFCQSQ